MPVGVQIEIRTVISAHASFAWRLWNRRLDDGRSAASSSCSYRGVSTGLARNMVEMNRFASSRLTCSNGAAWWAYRNCVPSRSVSFTVSRNSEPAGYCLRMDRLHSTLSFGSTPCPGSGLTRKPADEGSPVGTYVSTMIFIQWLHQVGASRRAAGAMFDGNATPASMQ